MDTSITIAFADGRYRFWLALPQILAIEQGEKSIMEIWSDLGEALAATTNGDEVTPIFLGGGPARFRDIIAVIKHGLIGGGEGEVDGKSIKVSPIDATRIVETFVHGRPLAESLPVAWAVLQAAVMGVKVADKKKEQPVKPSHSGKAKSSRTAASSA